MNTSEELEYLHTWRGEQRRWRLRQGPGIAKISHIIRPEPNLFHGKLDFESTKSEAGQRDENEEFCVIKSECVLICMGHKWTDLLCILSGGGGGMVKSSSGLSKGPHSRRMSIAGAEVFHKTIHTLSLNTFR